MAHIQSWALKLGLWPRMAIGISLGFLVLFVAFSLLGERALRDSSERLLEERMVIAQLTADQIDRVVAQAVSELEEARRFAPFDPDNPDLDAESRILAYTYGRTGYFTAGLIFLDTAGRVVLAYPADLYPPGSQPAALAAITTALAAPGRTIATLLPEPDSDQAVTAVIVPVYQDGRFLALLAGLIDLKGPAIKEPLQRAATLGHTGHALLVDDQGRTLASTFRLPFLSPGEHATFYRRAMTLAEPVLATVPNELVWSGEPPGQNHVMAFVQLEAAPWGVAVGGNANETFAGLRRLRFGLAFLGVIALAGTWTVTLLGTRLLVRPVQRLTEAAQRIAAGDLQTPLEAPEGGEISAMAHALDRMRSLLLGNIRELATWNETLEARVTERTEKLHQQQALTRQLLRRAITAQEEERARLSRELHDDIGQTLTAVQLSLDRLAKTPLMAQMEGRERLERARDLTERAIGELRHLIVALRPGVLDQLGLVAALGWVADHTLRPLGLTVTIDARTLRQRLPGEIEIILFRIAQEAMSNVARHSGALNLQIRLAQEDGRATMSLGDDGCGFDLATVTAAPDPLRGLGLAGMQERASLAGGQVTVTSAPGQGTAVHVVVPLAAESESELAGAMPRKEVPYE
jgi:signal transduction histidine kinase